MHIDPPFGLGELRTHVQSQAGAESDGDGAQHGTRLDDSEGVSLVLTRRSCPNAKARRHPRCLKGLTGNVLPPNPASIMSACGDFHCCCCVLPLPAQQSKTQGHPPGYKSRSTGGPRPCRISRRYRCGLVGRCCRNRGGEAKDGGGRRSVRETYFRIQQT